MTFEINIPQQPHLPEFRSLLASLSQQSPELFVVGGTVRDLILAQSASRPGGAIVATDIDIAVPENACQIAKAVADQLGWAYYPLDLKRDVARLVLTGSDPPLACDVARFQGESLTQDLNARDFTINAMAIQIRRGVTTGQLIDDHNGIGDLQARQIRRISSDSLRRDPLRMLRAVRLSFQLGFTIEQETAIQIRLLAGQINQVSQERIRDELWKVLRTHKPADAIVQLHALCLLGHIFPEVSNMIGMEQSAPHHLDVYQHSLLAIRHASFLRDWLMQANIRGLTAPNNLTDRSDTQNNRLYDPLCELLSTWRRRLNEHFCQRFSNGHSRSDWLVWLALLHDIGKPLCHQIEVIDADKLLHRFIGHEESSARLAAVRLTQLHFSGEEIKLATLGTKGHMRVHHLHNSFRNKMLSRRACYRFFRDTGRIQQSMVGIDLILLALADKLATDRDFSSDSPSSETVANWHAYLAHIDQLLQYGFDSAGIPGFTQPRLVDGHMLMERFGIAPGPALGKLIEEITEAQAAGEILTTDEAIDWAADKVAS